MSNAVYRISAKYIVQVFVQYARDNRVCPIGLTINSSSTYQWITHKNDTTDEFSFLLLVIIINNEILSPWFFINLSLLNVETIYVHYLYWFLRAV